MDTVIPQLFHAEKLPEVNSWWQHNRNPDLIAHVRGLPTVGPVLMVEIDLWARPTVHHPYTECMDSSQVHLIDFFTLFFHVQ